MTCREISDDLFTNPSTRKNSGLGIAEAPFQVWNDSVISALSSEIVWVGEVDLFVGSALRNILA